MYIEIMDNTIEPETRIRMTITQWVGMTISGICIICTVLIYFGVIPAKGGNETELHALSKEFATKEYVSTNYITKDKLLDTVINIQTQINLIQSQTKAAVETLDKRQERIENLLIDLIKKRSD